MHACGCARNRRQETNVLIVSVLFTASSLYSLQATRRRAAFHTHPTQPLELWCLRTQVRLALGAPLGKPKTPGWDAHALSHQPIRGSCAGAQVVVYYCRTGALLQESCARGGGVKRGDVCYGMLRAAACVDESDHHALMYVWHGQTVREDRVGEASARRP